MDSRNHFENSYRNTTFYPPRDIKFVIYSNSQWNHFLNLTNDKNSKIADLGCGGGTTLYCLEKLGYRNLYGLDFCNSIPEGFLKNVRFIQGDVLNSKFESSFFDRIISTMVIEHVNESLFVNEIHRILKPKGIALVTSVLKHKYSWYFYKNYKGETVIEPSHIKEYKSVSEFNRIFLDKFDINKTKTPQLAYPITDPLFRVLLKKTDSDYFRKIPTKNRFFKLLRNIRVPIIGYRAIETLIMKKL